MTGDQTAQLIYLVLLASAIAGSAIVAGRSNLGKMAQQAAIWGLIFLGVIAAYGLWGDISQTVTPRQEVSETGQIIVPQGPDGHYTLRLTLNGADVDFIVDTGASQIVLSQRDARRAGLDLAALTYTGRAMTANGMVRTAPVMLDQVTLGGVTDRNIPAVVNEAQMEGSLLGMTYLQSFDRIEITDGQLVLSR